MTVDHAKPRSRGGLNVDDNLLPACEYCNNEKSNLTVSEYRKFCKVKVIRQMMELGIVRGDLSKVRIVFFGEGNDSPFVFSEFRTVGRSSENWKRKFVKALADKKSRFQSFITAVKGRLYTNLLSAKTAAHNGLKSFDLTLLQKTERDGESTPTTPTHGVNTD